MEKLIQLPWQTLLTLACGYAGYYVANTGIRDHHKQADVLLRILLFGFISQLFYQSVLYFWQDVIVWAAAVSFILTVATAALWRRNGRVIYDLTFRSSGVAYVDDFQSALHNSDHKMRGYAPTQITVWLKDGSVYSCDDLAAFNEFPMAPYVLGNSGDLHMYATLEQSAGGSSLTEIEDVKGAKDWGVKSYYFPASEITRIAFRNARMTTSD